MKVGSIIRKKILNDLLVLALACMVSLLFTQSNSQCYESLCKTKRDGSVAANTVNSSKSKKSEHESKVDFRIQNEAVLNSSDPVFQIREDFRFILDQAVNQQVTIVRFAYNKQIDSDKALPVYGFSIPIFHCQLLI